MRNISVIKANGEEDPYSEEKVINSMKRAGVPKDLQKKALKHLESKLYDKIPTKEIYKTLFDFIKKRNQPAAAKYSLKKSVFEFGPTGFPFEHFVAKIYQAQGYTVEVGVLMEGECVNHEVDVIAEKGNEKIMIEAKFHNKQGVKTDLQTALYVHSRFLDLKEGHNFTKGGLVTNTKLTTGAVRFLHCSKMELMSWDQPKGKRLPDLIEKTGVHPVTECVNLSTQEKKALLDSGVVLCKDVIDSKPKKLARITKIKKEKLEKTQEEVKGILKHHAHT